MMKLDKRRTKTLIERAHSLHDKLSDEIKSSISFCRVCSEHGRYSDVAETPFKERQRLIAISDSLKEVENMLIFLRNMQSWQLIDRHSALTRLEKSRLYLMEQVRGYQGKEIDVVKELNACFGNKRTDFSCNSGEIMEANSSVDNGKTRTSSFLSSFIRFYFNPWTWRWQKAVGIAVKLLAVSSTIQFYHSRQKYCSPQRKILSSVDSTNAREINIPSIISKSPLDVLYGRG